MFVLKIGQLEDENKMLRDRLKELEGTALTAINEKKTLSNELIKQKENAEAAAGKKEIVIVDKVDTKEIEEMSEAFKAVKKVIGQFMPTNLNLPPGFQHQKSIKPTYFLMNIHLRAELLIAMIFKNVPTFCLLGS